MKSVYVKLETPEKVQEFVHVITGLAGSFDLVENGYILDAKSLMGIFALDLTKPLELRIQKDTEENMQALAPFLAKGGSSNG